MSSVDEPRTLAGQTDTGEAARRTAAIPTALMETPEEREQRMTPLELFFDLVFVFAITQVTGFVSGAP